MGSIIAVENLKKAYGTVQAVDDISFAVEEGRLFAFLGPNGAGKSTTIDIISTLLPPDAGHVTIAGYALGKENGNIRSLIGAVFQDGVLDALLTVEENMMMRGRLYALHGGALKQAVAQAAESAGIMEYWKRPYGKLSGGQRRRADIARALIHAPKILFLDEPTTGLDPQTRAHVWETVTGLQRRTGMTVFLTTHYMEEAAEADHVVVIDHGRIVAQGTPESLRRQYTSDRLHMSGADMDALSAQLRAKSVAFDNTGGQLVVKLDGTLEALPILDGCRDLLSSFEVLHGTMDDAFIAITGKELRS